MLCQSPLVLPPNALIAAKATNKIIANITEYSTAVAASSFSKNLAMELIASIAPFTMQRRDFGPSIRGVLLLKAYAACGNSQMRAITGQGKATGRGRHRADWPIVAAPATE